MWHSKSVLDDKTILQRKYPQKYYLSVIVPCSADSSIVKYSIWLSRLRPEIHVPYRGQTQIVLRIYKIRTLCLTQEVRCLEAEQIKVFQKNRQIGCCTSVFIFSQFPKESWHEIHSFNVQQISSTAVFK